MLNCSRAHPSPAFCIAGSSPLPWSRGKQLRVWMNLWLPTVLTVPELELPGERVCKGSGSPHGLPDCLLERMQQCNVATREGIGLSQCGKSFGNLPHWLNLLFSRHQWTGTFFFFSQLSWALSCLLLLVCGLGPCGLWSRSFALSHRCQPFINSGLHPFVCFYLWKVVLSIYFLLLHQVSRPWLWFLGFAHLSRFGGGGQFALWPL